VAKGVIYSIAAWNYPFFTAINRIGPALLAGNAVVLSTPRGVSSLRLPPPR